MAWVLAVGLFIQLSGKVWLESGSAYNTQVYLWLLLPALVYLLRKLVTRAWSLPSGHYLSWLLFLLWVGGSAFWAAGAEKSPLSLAKYGIFIALFLTAVHVLLTHHEVFFRRALCTGFVVVALGALASLVYQFGWLDRPLAYRAFRIDRLGVGDFANYGWPVIAGIFHGAIAIWAVGYAVDKRTDSWVAIFWLGVFATLLLYVLLTYTRGAWFGLLGGCLAVVVLQNSRRGWLLLGLFTLGLLAAIFIWWDLLLFEMQSRQLSGREQIWEYFFEVMRGHWLFGHGLGTPFTFVWPDGQSISPHAHSLYLQQVYDSGLVALSLMGMGLFGLAHKAWRLRNNPWVRLAFPALVFALIAMLTDVERIFTRPNVYWTVFWLPVAVLLAVRDGHSGGENSES
ncbi:O-Antigen ligase [compost metagenome]